MISAVHTSSPRASDPDGLSIIRNSQVAVAISQSYVTNDRGLSRRIWAALEDRRREESGPPACASTGAAGSREHPARTSPNQHARRNNISPALAPAVMPSPQHTLRRDRHPRRRAARRQRPPRSYLPRTDARRAHAQICRTSGPPARQIRARSSIIHPTPYVRIRAPRATPWLQRRAASTRLPARSSVHPSIAIAPRARGPPSVYRAEPIWSLSADPPVTFCASRALSGSRRPGVRTAYLTPARPHSAVYVLHPESASAQVRARLRLRARDRCGPAQHRVDRPRGIDKLGCCPRPDHSRDPRLMLEVGKTAPDVCPARKLSAH